MLNRGLLFSAIREAFPFLLSKEYKKCCMTKDATSRDPATSKKKHLPCNYQQLKNSDKLT